MQIDPRNLRRLVARAEALLDGRYEALEARRSKGARDPHRLVVLIARANEMIDQLEREGRFELTGEYAVTLSELEAVVPLLEEAATIPGFEDAHLAQTKDYAHTAVMLSARAFLLGIASAEAVNFVPTTDSPTPDMNVLGSDAELAIEVYAAPSLSVWEDCNVRLANRCGISSGLNHLSPPLELAWLEPSSSASLVGAAPHLRKEASSP